MSRLAALLLLFSASVEADPIDRPDDVSDAHGRALAGVGLGAIEAVPVGQGAIALQTSFDAARHDVTGVAGGEVLLAHGVYAVGGALHEPGSIWRPYVGAKVMVLPSLAVAAIYKAEGFSEPEGEIELRVAASRRLGAVQAILDGSYGQDVDGRDRDAEAAAALLLGLGDRVIASTQSRARFALGSPSELHGNWDLVADVGAACTFGRYAARAGAGLSAVGAMRVTAGPMASLSLATFF
jgi:hypothetical protein